MGVRLSCILGREDVGEDSDMEVVPQLQHYYWNWRHKLGAELKRIQHPACTIKVVHRSEEDKRRAAIFYQQAETERVATLEWKKRRAEAEAEEARASPRYVQEDEQQPSPLPLPLPPLVASISKAVAPCPHCLFHQNFSCNEIQDLAADLPSPKWIRCLVCKLPVRLGQGCKHVSCRSCGSQFCSICGWDWPI